ncbi:hypothetical protein DENSPDRAFT_449186 [Dentipellis sp. KUC8613]|nr:hypothetical protein DENSPDRAFT_449186 [Dentipellis sp. KUC8613]
MLWGDRPRSTWRSKSSSRLSLHASGCLSRFSCCFLLRDVCRWQWWASASLRWGCGEAEGAGRVLMRYPGPLYMHMVAGYWVCWGVLGCGQVQVQDSTLQEELDQPQCEHDFLCSKTRYRADASTLLWLPSSVCDFEK